MNCQNLKISLPPSLSRLETIFNEDFTRKTIKLKATKVADELSKAKRLYFKYLLIWNALQKIIEEGNGADLKFHLGVLALSKRKDLATLEKESHILQLNKYLSNGSRKYLSSPPEIQVFLNSSFQAYLDELYATLYRLLSSYDYVSITYPSKKEDSVVECMRKALKKKDGLEKNVKATCILYEEQKKLYISAMVERVGLLQRIFELHKKKADFGLKVAKLYHNHITALRLKSRVLKLEITAQTYNEKTVAALTKIKNDIDSEKVKVLEMLGKKSETLSSYKNLGKTYETYVHEYLKLRKQIENVQKSKTDVEANKK